MGSRASQLRSRQQVEESSVVAIADVLADASEADLKANSLNNNNDNNNNSSNVGENVAKLRDTLQEIGKQILKENGDTQQLDGQQANGNSSTQPIKVSTLQRQASHIQSLAQRIRRSSSLRAPKLRGLIPSFVSSRRKVSHI